MTAIYLYGFVPPTGSIDFGAGIEPGRDVVVWPFDDVAAVVSGVTPGRVAPASDRPTPEEQTRIVAQALRHQEIVAAAFARGPVLPVRYGAVFSSRGALAQLVAAHRDRIAEFLGRVAGREEWAVKGHLQTPRAIERMLVDDPELAARREHLPAAPGLRYFQERKLQADAERRVHGWLAGALADVRAALRERAEGACELRRTAAPPGGQKFVSHDAFLVPRDGLSDWLARLDGLAARFADTGLTLAATGPWPPSSFAPALDGPPV